MVESCRGPPPRLNTDNWPDLKSNLPTRSSFLLDVDRKGPKQLRFLTEFAVNQPLQSPCFSQGWSRLLHPQLALLSDGHPIPTLVDSLQHPLAPVAVWGVGSSVRSKRGRASPIGRSPCADGARGIAGCGWRPGSDLKRRPASTGVMAVLQRLRQRLVGRSMIPQNTENDVLEDSCVAIKRLVGRPLD